MGYITYESIRSRYNMVLDLNNIPKLIEVNTSSFTDYFLQRTTEPVFGEFTDDVIDY